MNTQYMTTYANKWLKENYNLTLDIPININNRLSRTLGYFMVNKYRQQAIKIDISGKLIKHNTKEDVLIVLKHELVHYALFMLGKPYKDGQAYFENELLKHGLISNYRESHRSIHIPKHYYKCDKCSKDFSSMTRLNVSYKQYSCKCGGDLIYKGEK